MCRSFLPSPVPDDSLERALALALRAPSAGKAQGWSFVVLQGRQTELFWEHQASPAWLAHPSHPGLVRAPVVVLPLGSKHVYVERYAQADKAPAGPATVQGWAVPYWFVDTAFATMLLLLGAAQEGLGALFFSLRYPSRPLLDNLGVPEGWEPIGAVAIGWPSPDDRYSTSARRPARPWGEVVHKGRWGAT